MLPQDALREVRTIIVHDNCADGMASALLLHEVLPNAEIRFVQYGNAQLKLKPEPGMLFCDFSPHQDTWREFLDAGALMIDHHATVKPMVEAFGDRCVFGDEEVEPGICGAALAYRELWKPRKAALGLDSEESAWAERIIALASIRDTWRNTHPDWLLACELTEALRFFPAESWLSKTTPFAASNRTWWDSRIETGHWLFKKNLDVIKRSIAGAYRFTTPAGTRVVMFGGSSSSSDAAEALGSDADLIIGFDHLIEKDVEDKEVATVILSTRSHTGYNCAEMCKRNGGGGHTAAAGCSVKFNPAEGGLDPYSMARNLIQEYEANR